jgi:hypothetical protein
MRAMRSVMLGVDGVVDLVRGMRNGDRKRVARIVGELRRRSSAMTTLLMIEGAA